MEMQYNFYDFVSNQYAMMKQKINNNFQLAVCILMDGMGMATYLIPGVTEWFDIVWASLAAIIYWTMFGGWKGFAGGLLVFIEEGLPITDAIPSFTLTWLIRKTHREKKLQSVTGQ